MEQKIEFCPCCGADLPVDNHQQCATCADIAQYHRALEAWSKDPTTPKPVDPHPYHFTPAQLLAMAELE